ncbi:MAG: hypothetical protein DRQ55_08500 [Planctomycetota bacterium]|nr:MAG: hypothetical protein DRQ55_08500 [Planctomycetota bacterium]
MKLPEGAFRNATIALSLLAAGFALAYLRLLPHIERESGWTDGVREVSLDDRAALRYAVWDEPVPLGPAVNGPEREGRASVSPDGTQLVFAVGEPGLNADLWIADLVDGEPIDPRPLRVANSPFDEVSPAFGPDALWLASNRPGGEGGFDLLRCPWRDGVFEPAERLAPGLASEYDELDPAPVPGSRAVVFASDMPRGRRRDLDLYLAVPNSPRAPAGSAGEDPQRAPGPGDIELPGDGLLPDGAEPRGDGPERERAPTAPESAWRVEPLAALNSPFDERDPAFAADGRVLLLASDRDGGAGGFDLYRSMQGREGWLPPVPLVGVNGPGHERAPMATLGGFGLLLTSAPAGGLPDLHRARSRELFRLPGRPVGWLDLTVVGLLLLLAVLTWLGRRWEALDILAKCLLVSLVAHLLLMLWFREVYVEQEPVEPPPAAPSIRVRLSANPQQSLASAERAGELQAAPSLRAAAHAPEQADGAAPEGGELSPAARASLPAPSLATAVAPARAADSSASTRSERSLDVSVREPATRGEPIHSAEAPSLSLAASTGPTQARTRAAAADPTRLSPDAAGASATPPASAHAAALPVPLVASSGPATSTHAPVELMSQGSRAAARTLAVAAPPAMLSAATSGASADAGGLQLAETSTLALGAPATAATARPSLHSAVRDGLFSGNAPTRSAPRGASAPGAGATARMTSLTLPLPAASAGGGPATSRGAVDIDLGARSFSQAALDGGLTSGPPATLLTPATSPSAEQDLGALAASGAHPTGAGEVPGALALSAPSSRAAPSRAGAEPARPGRWRSSSDVLASATPAASPSARPLAAPVVLAASLPETRAGPFDHTPYRTRFGEARIQALEDGGGSEQTERAVAAGLAYLARIQESDGHWGSPDDFDDKYGHVVVGKTALCLLAFLGAGHSPRSGREHAPVARRAREFLLSVQDALTGHFGYSSSYSHAIATYALSECYALDGDARLAAPLRQAVSWIVQHQHKSRDARRFGGWGYYYPDDRSFDPWPRTSVSAWQIMALESARLAGLAVPDQTFEDARTYLLQNHDARAGVVLYSRDPERLASRYPTLPGSTPAGLFALSLLGEELDAPRWRSTIEFTLSRRPDGFREPSSEQFVSRAAGNLYFWYYGSLVLFRHGGSEWERWNQALQSTLLPAQRRDGSWQPISLYADYAGDDNRDRSYTTAMCVLSLEVYYRYFTPLLSVDAGSGGSR